MVSLCSSVSAADMFEYGIMQTPFCVVKCGKG
jgi:hypothetical protein